MIFQIIDLFDLYLFATEIGYGLVLGRGLLLLTHNSEDKILGVGLVVGLFFFFFWKDNYNTLLVLSSKHFPARPQVFCT